MISEKDKLRQKTHLEIFISTKLCYQYLPLSPPRAFWIFFEVILMLPVVVPAKKALYKLHNHLSKKGPKQRIRGVIQFCLKIA